jgi:hypothetical protein
VQQHEDDDDQVKTMFSQMDFNMLYNMSTKSVASTHSSKTKTDQ